MTDKIKLRATMTWTYEVNPELYEMTPDTVDPDRIARAEQADDDIDAMVSIGLDQPDFSFKVEVVK